MSIYHTQQNTFPLFDKKKIQLSCFQNIGFDFKRNFQPFLQIIFWSWNINEPVQASCSELKLIWCSKIAKMWNREFCRSASLHTPTHKGALQLEKSHPLPTTLYDCRMTSRRSGNRLGFSLLSTMESNRKWTIDNLKINLYKAQNCEGIFSNCLCHCLDHKIFIP